MKKIILFIMIITLSLSKSAEAQIDTVLIRGNISLRADVWCWELGKNQNALYADSITQYHYGRIANLVYAEKAQVQANGWGHIISIDSIPGFIARAIYMTVISAPGGEIAPYYTAAKNELESKSNLLPYLTPLIDNRTNDFQRLRDAGRRIAEPRPN